ncbi:MAG: phospholipase D-like domain-containing protein [Candidatus Nanoarchaeia archaeon]|jgi:phosphatidylserine/phosphatidylglycerophosphate/cardiolipin synthase-like enzyme|nr:phospholipase D-like domain-containing protein [Candidatus Nanoarchaeia archaeon]|tara:strand:+ start:776 stop:1342 length:567 start_codon:yes stop_codon:yes gene_type:complete
MVTDGRKINRSVVFVVGLFLGGLIVSFYVGPAYVALADSGVDGIEVVNDRDYFDRVFELIDSADESIHLAMFEIKYYEKYPDSEVNQLVEKLIEKNSEGVDVKIIVDQFLTDERAVEILKKSGVDIRWDSTSVTTHNKLMIVDGRVVLIGSTNWSYYSFSKNHESNVIFHDEESAGKFERYFEELWLS